MTKLKRNLITAALGVTLFSSAGEAGKPGGAGTAPSKLPVIAEFLPWILDANGNPTEAPYFMITDGEPYSDGNLNGGWSNMPGTGNFTLQLDGSGSADRFLRMNFSDRTAPPEDSNVTAFYYHGNTNALVPLFLSMNRLCSVNAWDPNDANNDVAICDSKSDTSSGSLKDMKYGGNDILVNFRSAFPDPLVNKAELKVHCGPLPDDRVNDNPYAETADAIRAECVRGRDGDNACMEWELTPYTQDPETSLSCRVFRRASSKGSFTYQDLGVYNMPFTLILQRDENGDGLPD